VPPCCVSPVGVSPLVAASIPLDFRQYRQKPLTVFAHERFCQTLEFPVGIHPNS
jgi:hypothetical protein